MTREQIHDYMLTFPHAVCVYKEEWECFLYKIDDKFFAMMSHNEEVPFVSLKCNPARAMELREAFEDVRPGYYLNKSHWNTINIENKLSDELMKELLQHSYDLVFASLTKKRQKELLPVRPRADGAKMEIK